jgi:virulence factor Mce-like protein
MKRRARASLAASPVLVGGVTVLITIVATVIAYTANGGLPFVPTYDVRAELPSGAKLVKGNEVRIGGFRVGIVDRIDPAYRKVGGRRRAIAVVGLKLDKAVKPLPDDTRVRVRPLSALGLKYIELTPGRSAHNLVPGATIALRHGSESAELETILSSFPSRTRSGLRASTEGLGDAFAGRGEALNQAIGALAPFLRHTTRVMRRLSDRRTRLAEFLPALQGTASQVAPVAGRFSALFTHAADTLDALGRDPTALRQTIERTPPTLTVATRSLRRSRPVLAALTDVAGRLQPAVDEMPHSLPPITAALRVGTPVLGRSVGLSRRLGAAAIQLRNLVRNPNTLISLRQLRTFVAVTRPAIQFIAPYQTVCDYSVYFFNGLGEHQSGPQPGGTGEPQLVKVPPALQPNTPQLLASSRPFDLQPGQGAQDATFGGSPAGRVLQPVAGYKAIDAQGNADCVNGQVGYPNGRLLAPFARKNHQGSDPNDPNDIVFGTLPDGTPAGQNAMVRTDTYPSLSGGTYATRKLGIKNLKDVP